jgi:hypothetical protein
MNMLKMAVVCAAVTSVLGATLLQAQTVSEKLTKLTGGARVKLTWAPALKDIYVLDTKEGKERKLPVKGIYIRSMPVISPDGNKVIFGNGDIPESDTKRASKIAKNAQICAIDFTDTDGKSLKVLKKGVAPLAVWRDPKSGIDWVYYSAGLGSDKRCGHIRRFQLNDPSKDELMWDKTDGDAPMSVSGDGKYASGQYPWPRPALVTMPNGSITPTADKGCNSHIAPDNSYRFFAVNSGHTELLMYDSLHKGKNTPYTKIPLAGKYIAKLERARYSNNAKYITFFGASLKGGNTFVPCVGKFNSQFDGLEEVVMIETLAGGGDFPYAWIESK